MKLENDKRNQTLDILKGIMIIAVILGHIAYTVSDGDIEDNVVFLFCYSWHMYCFMAVVGYIAGKYGSIGKAGAFQKRCLHLLWPYLLWTVVRACILYGFSMNTIIRCLFIDPLYWFLITQFVYEIIVLIAKRTKKEVLVFCLLSAVLIIFYILTHTELSRQMLLHFPYYVIGYALGRSKKFVITFHKGLLFSIPAFLLSMRLYSFKDRTHVNEIVTTMFYHLGMQDKLISDVLMLLNRGGWRIYNHLIVAALGVICFYTISLLISMSHLEPLKNGLVVLGSQTLQLYLISAFCYVVFFPLWVNWVLSILLCFGVPLTVSFVFKKFPHVQKVLFGI